MTDENMVKFGGYRVGVNLPMDKGAVWENVARTSRWGAPVIELNTNAHRLGTQALEAIRQQAKANDLIYTWHVPPSADEAGELAVPNDPSKNQFAVQTMEQSIKSALAVGARHITVHATHSAGRNPEGAFYVYDVQQKQVGMQKTIGDLSPKDSLEIMNKDAMTKLKRNIYQLESNKAIVDGMVNTANEINNRGINDGTARKMMILSVEATRYGQAVGIQPDDIESWGIIQEKALRQQPLTNNEQQIIKNYSDKVLSMSSDLKESINNQLKQLKPYENKPLITDGEMVMRQTVADNIAKIKGNLLKDAVQNKLSIGFENLPAQIMFSTPEELNDLRKKVVDKLVSEKKLTRPEAEQLIGFTFDFGHANTTRYIDIAGTKFASPHEFIEQLKGPIKHVHATDSVGIVDGHLPLGQGEVTAKEIEEIKKALDKSGFKGVAVHELAGSGLPVLYQSSLEFLEPGMYNTGGMPTSSQWGPSYLAASMTDPLMMDKDRGYFHESFADIF